MISKIKLLRSGLELSQIGLGLSRLHHLNSSRKCEDLIGAAWDLGITHFDTARLYGDGYSEKILGQNLGGRRTEATIATKFGLLPNWLIESAGAAGWALRGTRAIFRRLGFTSQMARSFTVATMQSSLATSLRLLKIDYVDILFLHEPLPTERDINEELFEALEKEKKAGKFKKLGIAGARFENITARFGEKIDVIQAPESGWDPAALIPDITYQVITGAPQRFGESNISHLEPRVALRRALARRPNGAVLVGTTNVSHLRDLMVSAKTGA